MVEDTIAVTNGDTTEVCTVLKTWSHRGVTVAEVQGDTISGFVEVADPSGSAIERAEGSEVPQ